MYSLRCFLRTEVGSFVQYVACPNCYEVYEYKDCIKRCGTKDTSEKCSRKIGRRPCGTLLLKSIKLSTGRLSLRPFKTYCYMPIKNSLQELLNRPGFQDACERWRNRKVTEGVMSDIYDGKIWKDYQEYKGEPFLSLPFIMVLC